MSTNDVPGFNPSNNDQLAMGCWAEHEDGSLILVEGTEAGRVIYSVFDVAQDPVTEYRNAQPEDQFKADFSFRSGQAIAGVKWTWHDKTPFPWNRVIKQGARDGVRYADVQDHLSAALRIAQSLQLRGAAVARDLNQAADGGDPRTEIVSLLDQLARAVGRLPNQP